MPPEYPKDEDWDEDWLEGDQWSEDPPEIIIDFEPGERKKEPWEEEEGEFDLDDQLLLQVVLPGREPPATEFSQLSEGELIGRIPPEGLMNLPPDFRPQKTLEQLCQSEEKDIVMVCEAGHGKTLEAILYGLDQVYADESRYILSFTHSRAVGRTQQQKFNDLSGWLVEGSEACEAYYYGDDWLKQAIREGERDYSMLLITPYTYAGSYAHYAGELAEGHPAAVESFLSDETTWLKRLESPWIVLIDEVDSFPTSTLLWLVPLVRVLKWRNNHLKVILGSATLGNPDAIAQRFLAPWGHYEVLYGTGRRGKLDIRVYLETQREKLLEGNIQEILDHIDTELSLLDGNPSYNPKKVLLFINHKIVINIRGAIRRFTDNFVLVHGDMNYDEIAEEIEIFRTDPDKICLVATQLVEAGLDLPDIFWQVCYGLPLQPRQFKQLRDRTNRRPEVEGRLDIILRRTNPEERKFAAPERREELETYILNQDPDPLHLPWYTPWSLRFWLAMGVLSRFPEVMRLIQDDLGPLAKTAACQRHLSEAVIDLYVKRVVRYDADGHLHATPVTKDYITDFLRKFADSIYDIVCEENGKEIELGRVPYSAILRHYWVGQSLPFKNHNYLITAIVKTGFKENAVRQLRVQRKAPELYWFWNQVETRYEQSEIYALHKEREIGLVQISVVEEVTETSKAGLEPNIERHLGVFIGGSSPWALEITALLEMISQALNIASTNFQILPYTDEVLGRGTLFIDMSTVELGLLLYDYLITADPPTPVPQPVSPIIGEHESLGKIPSHWKPKFRRFDNFAKKYTRTVVFLADLHLNGKPFRVGNQMVDLRRFFRELFLTLQHASLIIFLGDTVEIPETRGEELIQALAQLHDLYEVLESYHLLEKTIFLLGNHDYDAVFYRWHKRIRTADSIALQLTRTTPRALISHGDNIGLETLFHSGNPDATQLLQWKTSLEGKIGKCSARREDWVVVGHHHTGRQYKKQRVLMVPSMQNFWRDLPEGRGWLGLLGYANPYHPESCESGIDS